MSLLDVRILLFHHVSKFGGECVAHAVQALTEADPSNTILSVDGVGAVLPSVRQFYGRPSSYLWDNEDGQVHEIVQGEGGEQGDPLIPTLFALGQHAALVAVQDILFPSEKLFAFLYDIYAVVKLEMLLKSMRLWSVNCGFMHASTSIKG